MLRSQGVGGDFAPKASQHQLYYRTSLIVRTLENIKQVVLSKNDFTHHFNSISNHFVCLHTVLLRREHKGIEHINYLGTNGFFVATLIPITYTIRTNENFWVSN